MLEKLKEKNQERKKQENLHLGQKDSFWFSCLYDNKDFFTKNPRLGMMVRTLEKMPEEKRKEHFKTAKKVIGNMK